MRNCIETSKDKIVTSARILFVITRISLKMDRNSVCIPSSLIEYWSIALLVVGISVIGLGIAHPFKVVWAALQLMFKPLLKFRLGSLTEIEICYVINNWFQAELLFYKMPEYKNTDWNNLIPTYYMRIMSRSFSAEAWLRDGRR